MYTDPTKRKCKHCLKWKADGWNVAIFYWNQMADEDEVKDAEAKIWSTNGPKGMRYRLNTVHMELLLLQLKSVSTIALLNTLHLWQITKELKSGLQDTLWKLN